MGKRDVTNIRGAIEFLKEQNEIVTLKGEVDTIYEIAGILKALDGGIAVLFENIKGYPGVRCVGNIFVSREKVAKIFGVHDAKKLKFKCLEAIKNPIPPKVVLEAPCQEVVISEDVDVPATLPLIKHSELDCGPLLGGGNTLVSGKYYNDRSHVAFNRMNFRGKNWASINLSIGSHIEEAMLKYKKGERLPITINIGTPPAVMMVAGTSFIHTIVPPGADELGFAGGLQGSPIEIVKAKTVDAYAIANSEWVIEGCVNIGGRVWESNEAEKLGKIGVVPFFPEWTGHLGRAAFGFKFQATAITHRKDRPIFYAPLAHSIDMDISSSPFREACFYELAERVAPGLVVDVNILDGVAGWGGCIVFQVNKKMRRYEGYQRNILMNALSSSIVLRLAIAVDEDVDIYSAEDLLFAIITRMDPVTGIIKGGGGKVMSMMPTEKALPSGQVVLTGFKDEGPLAFDATAPFDHKETFRRGHYPVDKVDLTRWLSEGEISAIQQKQSNYAKILAKEGW